VRNPYLSLLCISLLSGSTVVLAAPEPPVAAEPEAPPADGAEAEATDDEAAAANHENAQRKAFEAALAWKQGKVTVGDGLATLNVPPSFRYLDPADAERVLLAWGNPPGSKNLGMLFPTSLSPFDDGGWGVVISYTEEGHVDDEDAADIDYAEMLDEMKKDTEESNGARRQQNFGEVHLIGWAEPPRYDAKTKKMYWAKELDFGGEQHTLNYDIRVLGRKGVLELSAVSSISQLAMVKAEMPKVLSFVEFTAGNTYADFTPGVDTVAAYGIGALVAGKVAAKAGLFKIVLAGILASKKLILAGLVGLGALVKSMLGRKKDSEVT